MIALIASMMFMVNTDVKKVNVIDQVNVGGVHVLTVRGANASERANRIQERLCSLLFPNMTAADITASRANGCVSILVKDHLLFTATANDAKANKMKLDDYASSVLNKLKKVLPEVSPVK